MKLSKAQQRVVNLMKEGWDLRSSKGFDPFAYLREGDGLRTKSVSMATLYALLDKRVIIRIEASGNIYKYKLNKQNPQ